MTNEIVQALVSGILIGGVYAVISAGLTLVFGVMNIVNFAQGEYMMLGMYVAYIASQATGIDPILLSVLAFVVVFCIGWLVQDLLIDKVLDAPMISQIFLTIAISLLFVSAAELTFGSDFKSVHTPYQTAAVHLHGITLGVPYILAFCVSVVITFALWLLIKRTDVGRAMRATSQNRVAAQLVGLNPKRIYAFAAGLGTGLAALGGAVILPYIYVYPTVGRQYVVIMFTVVILSGLGSIVGAIVGGLIIGVAMSFSGVFMPTEMQNVVLFVLFLGTLAIRPSGLFGARYAK
ncbi:Branched-chain amino acid transport system permease protein OS=Castellaniella defragrans OX=75697 GN=HNR28_000956 PE=3 SV=1 [Castellaniella defragrans]